MNNILMNQINDYSQIRIIKDSLIVFDIDDTVIKFPELGKTWWKNKFDNYYKLYNDYDKADILTLEEWVQNVTIMEPTMINKESFIDFFDKALENNCKIIFLTARNEKLKDLTYQHLIHCDFIPSNIITNNVYFSEDKGTKLKNILNLPEYFGIKNVIFIDDIQDNLKDVYNHLYFDYDLDLYQFIYN
jgi:hypothetical protein